MSDSKIFNALNIAAIQFNERACVFDNKSSSPTIPTTETGHMI